MKLSGRQLSIIGEGQPPEGKQLGIVGEGLLEVMQGRRQTC